MEGLSKDSRIRKSSSPFKNKVSTPLSKTMQQVGYQNEICATPVAFFNKTKLAEECQGIISKNEVENVEIMAH
ncbi:hypothetical protein DAPPUDRAFT_265246 [Daphnia pulex]|uniref:Uncharacterized protein n=1 Tax=Daphnia pulex TaxID=6669 RepID=E9HT46_DAPPU|nr:hypothetical protein DAPPUDRAFT_265246 [Daphnia pulex]|eukprot:EFX65085.1 hypothetical protein DAPPUDRAFT_265246 [Daphnia pulex]